MTEEYKPTGVKLKTVVAFVVSQYIPTGSPKRFKVFGYTTNLDHAARWVERSVWAPADHVSPGAARRNVSLIKAHERDGVLGYIRTRYADDGTELQAFHPLPVLPPAPPEVSA